MNQTQHAAPGPLDAIAPEAWALDPRITFLNHGSFGACPRAVLAAQDELRRRLEADPVRFFTREAPPLVDAAREALARLVGAEPEDLVFVRNATSGVAAVLRSLRLGPGDEVLVTDHGYNACRCAAELAAGQAGARVVVASVPVTLADEGDKPHFASPRETLPEGRQAKWDSSPVADLVVEAILAAVTPRTRLAIVDHITSPTAIVLPIGRIVAELDSRGVDTLVDGAHAPGMATLDLEAIGAAYYTGNLHKWLCAPKGAGFLQVRRDRHEGLHPAVVSHGYNVRRPGRSRLHDEFDWTGTDDLTPWLCVPAAIDFLEGLLPGGLGALMARNRALAVHARRVLCEALGGSPLCPEEMLGSMAAVRLPDEVGPAAMDWGSSPTPAHPLHTALLERHGIEVPVYHWPGPPRQILRVSAQAYNSPPQYERLARAVSEMF